jgi:hypothetical protein
VPTISFRLLMRPKADFADPSDQHAQLGVDLRVGLLKIETSNANSSENRPCANARASRAGRW